MTPRGVLLILNRTPGATLRIARRLEAEVPNVKVCGIVLERPQKTSNSVRTMLDRVRDLLLGLAHAFPVRPDDALEPSVDEFKQVCSRKAWPLLLVRSSDDETVGNFVRECVADLGLVLGTARIDSAVLGIPRQGFLRVNSVHVSAKGNAHVSSVGSPPEPTKQVRVAFEPTVDSKAAPSVITFWLPGQPFDTPAGVAMKTELISNDLMIKAVECLALGKAHEIPERLAAWTAEMLPACFDPEPCDGRTNLLDSSKWRTRPAWKLCLHTLVLFSPYVVARNWYRRWRGKFPVVILFHHLISDRPHRMGIPTEIFLREVKFLQKCYRVVSLSEAMAILRSGSPEVPVVVLTFDDGYEDNFLNLRAVTEATGVPVSLFVCTTAVSAHEDFQHDRKNGQSGFRALSWNQIRNWKSDQIEFGSHTRSHFDCGSPDIGRLEDEIVGSREDMGRQLGDRPRFFAFPWGKAKNMSSQAIEVASAKYECSFSTLECENLPSEGNLPKVAGRKALPSTVWELDLVVQSIFDLASRVRR
jgi:peptidoglycan/xylan/chitin deacetylase (PgdA/CDA1 family)